MQERKITLPPFPWESEKRLPTKIYVFKMNEFCKVGVTVNALRRKKAIETHSPYSVDLSYYAYAGDQVYPLEKAAHKKLSDLRHRNEWFKCSPQESENAIKAVANDMAVELKELEIETNQYA